MKTSPNGINLIKKWEGLRLSAYQDSASVWTIGWGHTHGVSRGDSITESDAERYLSADIANAEYDVHKLVTVDLNQNQFDALVSFVFNVGGYGTPQRPRFRESTLLKKINAGDFNAACAQLNRWVYAGGEVLGGLASRRADECALFSKPIETVATPTPQGSISPAPVRVEREKLSQSRTTKAGGTGALSVASSVAVSRVDPIMDKVHWLPDALAVIGVVALVAILFFRREDWLKSKS